MPTINLENRNSEIAPVLENFKDGWNPLGSCRSAMAGIARCIALSGISCQELCYVFCSLKDLVTGSRTVGPPLFIIDNRLAREMAAATAAAKSLGCICGWLTPSLWIFTFLAGRPDAAGESLSNSNHG